MLWPLVLIQNASECQSHRLIGLVWARRMVHLLVTESGTESEPGAFHCSCLWKRTEEEKVHKFHMPRGMQMLEINFKKEKEERKDGKKRKAKLVWEPYRLRDASLVQHSAPGSPRAGTYAVSQAVSLPLCLLLTPLTSFLIGTWDTSLLSPPCLLPKAGGLRWQSQVDAGLPEGRCLPCEGFSLGDVSRSPER